MHGGFVERGVSVVILFKKELLCKEGFGNVGKEVVGSCVVEGGL